MSRRRRNTWIAILLLLAGIAPWFIRSDVERLVVLQRHVLLGRYAAGWFAVMALGITPACWLGAWVSWRLRTGSHRAVAFRLIALAFALALGIVLVEVAGRMLRRPTYVISNVRGGAEWALDQQPGAILHRVPDQVYDLSYIDEPSPARSYPGHPASHPPVKMTLTTDTRGFRNAAALERADIVVLGDSFAEGCLVSDEHAWPVRLAALREETVYNLGMSGGDPAQYRNTLRGIGRGLSPRVVIATIYENNDFEGVPEETAAAPGVTLDGLFRTSPIANGLARALVAWFGPIHADAPLQDFEAISAWMPMRIPDRDGGTLYTLKPKRILQLIATREAFEHSPGWTSTVPVLRDIKRTCAEMGARLVFVLAPTRPRVLLPHVERALTPEQLYAFVSKRRNPRMAAAALKASVYANMNHMEAALAAFCEREDIEFLSLTKSLIEATAAGKQVYYGYDQHWTPYGNELVAQVIDEALGAR